MTAVPASGFTSVPAYRVVAHFVKQVKKLEPESALDALELKVRQYVRSLLAPLHGSWAEIGERWAVAQLGDPDLETLGQALQAADKDSPRSVVEDALRVGSQLLPRPDLAARFLLLPGDGDSKLMCQVMNGAMGITLGSQATLLFFWPMAGWLNWLGYTTVHEYTHLVRNHLFPRSLSGGRLVYQKTQEQETLLDAMVAEGISDALAQEACPGMIPAWATALDDDEIASVWPRVKRRLKASDPNLMRRFISGDGDRIPLWTGYSVGNRIVQSYLEHHPGTRPSNLVGMQASTIFAGSTFASTT